MAVVTLLPASTMPYNTGNWTFVGSYPTALQTNDGDTTMIQCEAFWSFEMFAGNFDDLPASAISVQQVDATDVSKKTEASTADTFQKIHRVGSTNYTGTAHALVNGTYNSYTDTNVTYGPGGGWDVSKVNGILWGGREAGSGTSLKYIRCTQLYLTVTYTPGGGCLVAAWSHLLPLLGTITTLAELNRFLMYCHLKSKERVPTYTREELEMIRQELRNLKRGYSCPSISQFRRQPGKMLYSLAA